MKLGRLVFSCNGSTLSVVSEDDHERAEITGHWPQSSHDFQAPLFRTNVASTIDYADRPALTARSQATQIGMDSKARLNTPWVQPYSSLANKTYAGPRSCPTTHVQLDDTILVPIEVLHTASQMTSDPTSMRTLNWAVAHAAPVVEVDKHIRGVSFAALPKKECKRETAPVPVVAHHTETTIEQPSKENSFSSEPTGSLIQAVQEPVSAVDVPKATVSPATYVRSDKLIDIVEEQLPLPPFMRPTAIVLSRQHAPISSRAPLPNPIKGPLHASGKYSVASCAAHQGGDGKDRRCKVPLPSVATNRAAALRAAHGKAMRQKLADDEPVPKQKNFDKASAQYKALLFSNNKKKLESVSESKQGMSSVRSVAATSRIASTLRPGPVSSPAAATKLGSEKRRSNSSVNPTTMIQPGPVSSPAATNRPNTTSDPLSSGAEDSKLTGQPATNIKAAPATNSIAVQTDDIMPGEVSDTPAEAHTETSAQMKSEEETTTDSPGVVKQRLVARLWQGVPSDYVVKNVHL